MQIAPIRFFYVLNGNEFKNEFLRRKHNVSIYISILKPS